MLTLLKSSETKRNSATQLFIIFCSTYLIYREVGIFFELNFFVLGVFPSIIQVAYTMFVVTTIVNMFVI